MKKIIKIFIALMILMIIFAGCSKNTEHATDQQNPNEQENDDSFKEDTLEEDKTESLSNQVEVEDEDEKLAELNALLKMGIENKNQYNGVYYKSDFVGKDGEIFTSETWLNIVTAESKVDYYFVDEDGTLTRIILYKLMSGTHIYSPTDNFMMSLPMTAYDIGDDIPLVPLTPSQPATVEEMNSGVDMFEFKGYEESEEGKYIVYANKTSEWAHTIWLDKKTGLIAKQRIASDEGVMDFYNYRYFDIDDGEFVLPEDVETR